MKRTNTNPAPRTLSSTDIKPLTKGGIVKYEDCVNETYAKWSKLMAVTSVPSRKQWEDVYIAQALYERGMLQNGKSGIGFGVGRERMVSLFASFGCTILATDQSLENNPKAYNDWYQTGQLSTSVRDLHYPAIVPVEEFDRLVTFENCDMNAIPEKYFGQFDFTYSACSLDHLGTLEKGLLFIENSLKCLKPGGWAIHTTEYNVGSNEVTEEEGSTVFYRQKDIEAFTEQLRAKGYLVEDTDYSRGEHPENFNVDYEPHQRPSTHLVLQVCRRHIVSSILFIAQRPL